VARLLTEHRDPDARDDDGASCLHHAARIGSMRLVECLLWFGANPNLREVSRFGGVDAAIDSRVTLGTSS